MKMRIVRNRRSNPEDVEIGWRRIWDLETGTIIFSSNKYLSKVFNPSFVLGGCH